MGLLSESDVKYLKDLFEKELEDDVNIVVFKSDEKSKCEYCDITLEVLEELSDIDPRIKLHVLDIDSDLEQKRKYGVELVPAIVFLTSDGEDKGVRYFGIPSGHEFSTVIQNVISFSKGAKPELSSESIEKISGIDIPVEILVFVTPTCPYCPRAVLMAHEIAKANEKIKAAMVEANEFPELSMRYGVSAVPHIVVNDENAFVGAYPEKAFVDYIVQYAKG